MVCRFAPTPISQETCLNKGLSMNKAGRGAPEEGHMKTIIFSIIVSPSSLAIAFLARLGQEEFCLKTIFTHSPQALSGYISLYQDI